MKKIVFNSGLPRSGSTLLAALLNQNPRFHANMSVPIRQILDNVIESINRPGNNNTELSPEKIDKVLRGILENYHSDEGKEVFFDHNRYWSGRHNLLKRLYPDHKMILTVRDIGWILDSYENLGKNSIYKKPLYTKAVANSDVYSRCNDFLNVIYPIIENIKDLLHANNSNVLIIEYDLLASNPELVMRSIYEHIEEPYFNHDFNNVTDVDGYKVFDEYINMPGIHKIRKKVSLETRDTVIPRDIWNRTNGMEVWKN